MPAIPALEKLRHEDEHELKAGWLSITEARAVSALSQRQVSRNIAFRKPAHKNKNENKSHNRFQETLI